MPAPAPTPPSAVDTPVDPRRQRRPHERRPPLLASAHASAGRRYRPKPLISSPVSGGSGVSRGHRGGGPKEIFCAFGIDVDAVAGWLGSYGGEDSPCDVSRGLFSGEVGVPRLVELFRRFGIRTTWFIPGHSAETFPRPVPHGGRRRPRDRGARLFAREPHRDDPRAGDRGARQVHRPHREAGRAPADRLRRALVGVQPRHQRAAARTRHQVRPQPDEQRLPSLLRPGGGHLDEDRLRQGRPRVDEAAGAGPGRRSSSTSRATGTSTTCRR